MDYYQKIKTEIESTVTTGNELFDKGRRSGLKVALFILDKERAMSDFEDLKEMYGTE
jgi:hypothetical protein